MDRIMERMLICNQKKIRAYQIMKETYSYIKQKGCESLKEFATLKAYSFNQALESVNEYYLEGLGLKLTMEEAIEVLDWTMDLLTNKNIARDMKNRLAKTRIQTAQIVKLEYGLTDEYIK